MVMTRNPNFTEVKTELIALASQVCNDVDAIALPDHEADGTKVVVIADVGDNSSYSITTRLGSLKGSKPEVLCTLSDIKHDSVRFIKLNGRWWHY